CPTRHDCAVFDRDLPSVSLHPGSPRPPGYALVRRALPPRGGPARAAGPPDPRPPSRPPPPRRRWHEPMGRPRPPRRTPLDLLAAGGVYADLHALQFQSVAAEGGAGK